LPYIIGREVITMKNEKLIIQILKNQVKPALGCTEPGAVALAVARAKEILGEEVKKLNIVVNKNILKNGLGVGIPGTRERGLVFGAALALIIGKSQYGLEVFKDVNDESIQRAFKIMNDRMINLELDKNAESLFISVEAIGARDRSKVVIKDSHTNMVFESKNDITLINNGAENNGVKVKEEKKLDVKNEIKKFNIDDLIEYATNIDIHDLAFIQEGIDMNMRLAHVGVSEELGVGYGKYLYSTANDPYSKAKALTAGASEARMSGYPLPVMSSAGSGNHGLVAIIPVNVVGTELGISKEKIIRSVTLSHLVTIYIKSYLGALSPICGCGVAAGVGCAAGLTYLMDGSKDQIKGAIGNMIAGITGMICDGAKLGCASKLSISVDASVEAARMALRDIFIPSDNGILGDTAEQTIINLAQVSTVGMNKTDDIILDVMLSKC